MAHTIWMRRLLTTALVLTALLTISPAASANIRTASQETSYNSVSNKLCPINWREGRWFVKQLIRCASAHYDIRVHKALHIARRESNFRPKAYNSWSCAKGIYQHLCRYWPGRAYDYGFKGWSAYNARANVIVTMKMVRRYGWTPWGR
jgi:hypothetical protein